MRRLALAVLAAFLWLFAPDPVAAHDIPGDATVRVFIKVDGDRLRYLIRVPMASIHDIEWPLVRQDGTLDLPKIDQALRDAANMWYADEVDMLEGSTKLKSTLVAVRLSNEGDPSFASYDEAVAHLKEPPLPPDTRLLPTQGMLDAMFEYPIQSDRSRFAFHPHFDRFGLRVLTVMRFLPASGEVRAFEYEGGDPGIITLDPSVLQAAWTFIQMGFRHILDGVDHVLFLLCLVIPFRKFRALVPIVTGFTVAHSVTLIASAYDMAPTSSWFPPLVDLMIAASILYMALENIAIANPRKRWILAFGFGLFHGFAFAIALRRTLQFGGSHFLTSLLAFNVGLELGQVFLLALLVPTLIILFRYLVPERAGVIVLSALAGHTAWHWTLDRYAVFSKFPLTLPPIDATFMANALRWAMVIVVLAFAAWLTSVVRAEKRTS